MVSFSGAIIAVSHDRYFLDKIADTIFDFRGNGTISKYLGCYSEYCEVSTSEPIPKRAAELTAPVKTGGNKKLKFTFKEQREFESIDSEIAGVENEILQLSARFEAASSDYVKLQELMALKEVLDRQLEDKMERWVYLNDLAEKIAERDK